MINWKKIIPKGKFLRIKKDTTSVKGAKEGLTVTEGWDASPGRSSGYILGNFFYAVEHTSQGVEYFRYRIVEVPKYAVDTKYKKEYTPSWT